MRVTEESDRKNSRFRNQNLDIGTELHYRNQRVIEKKPNSFWDRHLKFDCKANAGHVAGQRTVQTDPDVEWRNRINTLLRELKDKCRKVANLSPLIEQGYLVPVKVLPEP